MLRLGREGKLIFYAVGASLFSATLIAGMIRSLRVDHRLPVIDLFESGSRAYINELVAHQDLDGAINQLELQTRLLPLDAATYEYLGNLLGTQGRAREAQEQFQELVRLRPDYAEGYYFLGSTYLDTNFPATAAKYFKQAIRLNPDLPLAANGLGVAHAQLGEMPEAEKCFARAVELSPSFRDARTNLERARAELRGRP